jgi:uncharacterized protein
VATRVERFPQLFLGLVVLSGGFALGSSAVGDGLRARSGQEMITVTGSARKTIISDTVVWRASVTSTQPTPAEASRELAAWVGRVTSFLHDAGASEDEVRVDPVTTETIAQLAPEGRGDTGRVAGYRLSRAFEVRSSRVKELTDIVQKSSALLNEGIPLTAQPPQYRYAQLAKIRPGLLAEASRDAKTRGQRLVTAAGGRLGRLQSVSTGVIQITAPDASDTSGEGVYDTSTIEKDVTAVVRLTFGLR